MSDVRHSMEQWLATMWRESVSDACEMLTGGGLSIEELPRDELPSGEAAHAGKEEGFWRSQTFDVADRAALFVGVSEEQRLTLGTWILRAGGVEEPAPRDSDATYSEFLQQAVSVIGTKIGARVGLEVCVTASSEEAPPSEARPSGLRILNAEGVAVNLFAHFSLDLIDAVTPAKPTAPSAHPVPSTASHNLTETPVDTRQAPKTMDLLLDVELPVSVSFGRANLPLRDVLKLTSGSIVELDRSVSDTVEIIVNNCRIARGEVVVVEGNYGVRVTQIISRPDRLRTMN